MPSKKPLETKFKELQDKYKLPKNCNLMCVPKVNLELWHDLPRVTKSKDLHFQGIQKNLVKSAQLLIQLSNTVLKFQHDNKSVDSVTIIPLVGNAITLLGPRLLLDLPEETGVPQAGYCTCLSIGVQ